MPVVVAQIPPDARQIVNPGGGQIVAGAYAAVAATAAPVQGLSAYGAIPAGKSEKSATSGQNGDRARVGDRSAAVLNARSNATSGQGRRGRGQQVDVSI
ncbi:MAG: hypothetical protein P4M00_15420 [Azospirillaceae bacterium]|nr:hypothetical protein [Azospirillaceae bacterium]